MHICALPCSRMERHPPTLHASLVRVCVQARDEAGQRHHHIAVYSDTDPSTVSRFEQRAGWPSRTEELVAGYAKAAGVEPLELWARALKDWAVALAAFTERPADDNPVPRATPRPSTAAPKPRGSRRSRGNGLRPVTDVLFGVRVSG